MDAKPQAYLNDIAIIGMALRFPGAGTAEQYWRNLVNGVESVTRIDPEVWGRLINVEPALLEDPAFVKARPQIQDVDLFDAAFFGYTPREAEVLDPQQRLFLECCWEALERAGYDTLRYPGSIGVCAGISQSSYQLFALHHNLEVAANVGTFNVALSNMNDSLATRVAYKLNLRGASYSVQCFCSTSLVATHMACQSLLSHETDVMLAGGVTIAIPQDSGYRYQEGGILSPDGHTRTFDAKGAGMVFGNGVGVVVLKRLADALEEGDTIHAVIKGSAINNDGSLKLSYTAPSVAGQAAVITEALSAADVDPATISYVEAHGTATALGDPAEIAALTRAYRQWTDRKGYCAIGSAKTNIGHLDAAAGVAGLIKTVMMLKHRQIPPSLHFETPNPQIDFASSPFYVADKLRPWDNPGGPRRAGVSAFGIGGTNAHAILEEAPPQPAADPSPPWQVLVLSAKTPPALDEATRRLASHLAENPAQDLADVAYTLQTGRREFEQRRIVVCRDTADAAAALAGGDRAETQQSDHHDLPVAFMFTGQGSQYLQMGAGLRDSEPVFRETLQRCSRLLAPALKLDLEELLYASGDDDSRAAEVLQQTAVTQPALFALEYALAQLWMSWGVRPQAMIGHSIGEYVAACLAGVFTLEDALAVVAERGRLMQSLPAGAMLAVNQAEADLAPLLTDGICLATINAPSACVLSGPIGSVDRLEQSLAARGVHCRRLHTSHAFHSSMMDPILAAFEERLAATPLGEPALPVVSNLTGEWLTAEQARDPGYWARHLRNAVRFCDGLGALTSKGPVALLEIGPGNTLTALARQQQSPAAAVVSSIRHPKDPRDDRAVLMEAVGKLWLAGATLEWPKVHGGRRRRRVALPTYPFERRRYWIDPAPELHDGLALAFGFSNKRQPMEDWFYQPSWRRIAEPAVQNASCPPGAVWLVFTSGPLGAAIIDGLRRRGQRCVEVQPGSSFGGSAAEGYTISGAPDHYAALLRDLAAASAAPTHIVHLWGADLNAAPGLAGVDAALDHTFYSLLYLTQAIGRQGIKSAVHLAAVTRGMQVVIGDEPARPELATVLGPCRVAAQEMPNVTCRCIDVSPVSEAGINEHWLADRILGEVLAPHQDFMIAYRKGARWVQWLEPVQLEAPNGQDLLRSEGVYFITGGLGGIGLVLAGHLARNYRARLVLTGRSALPPRPQWNDRAGLSPRQARCIQEILAMEQAGGEVLVLPADVSDLNAMRAAVAQARERFGSIDGVIHAAGLPGGGIIQLKDKAQAHRVLQPKVHGTLILEEALAGASPRFIALCSSTAAILGGFGQVDYCAANAFLDAFAHSRPAAARIVSINWDAWKEVGMAVETAAGGLQATRNVVLKLGISPAEGAQAFEWSLASGLAQVAISKIDMMPKLLRRRPRRTAEPQVETAAGEPGGSVEPAEQGPGADIERTIADVWKRVLGIDRVGANDNFFELGGDSLTALQVIGLLKSRLGTDLAVVTFYEAPTVSLLAKALGGGSDPAPDRPGLDEVGQRAETRLELMQRRRRQRIDSTASEG